jgi:hypothetical protein
LSGGGPLRIFAQPLHHAPAEHRAEHNTANDTQRPQPRIREGDDDENRSENPVHGASITARRRNLTANGTFFFTIPTGNEEQDVMGTTPRNENEGEGNKTADRNYREATQKFVESERGREEIEKAGNVDAREEREIERAEEEAKRHAKK